MLVTFVDDDDGVGGWRKANIRMVVDHHAFRYECPKVSEVILVFLLQHFVQVDDVHFLHLARHGQQE